MITGHLPELLIVLVVALIVFGPKRLPEIGSSLGKGIRDFRQGVSSLGDEADQQPVPVLVEPQSITPAVPSRKAG
jgi:sec-independent protein translocase protein TatA